MTQQGSRILVLGLGISGFAAAMLAQNLGAQVSVLDTAESATLEARAEKLKAKKCDVFLGWNKEAWEPGTDLCIISPGVAPESLLGRLARRLSCPVISELEYAFEHISCPILAVSGTNGKTTTVELTAHILLACGKRVATAGNIGRPLAELVSESQDLDLIVAEVSSFQLEGTSRFAPMGAACLNVTSDHMDRYPDFSGYLEAKLKLFSNIPSARQAVLNQALWEIPGVRNCFGGIEPVMFSSVISKADFYIEDDWLCSQEAGRLIHQNELALKGRHNLENIAAALALCRMVPVPLQEALEAVRCFVPGAHRLEEVFRHGGVRYVNDSKATNPDALIRALETCDEGITGKNVILIAGGRDKQMDFSKVLPVLKRRVRQILLIGETGTMLKEAWEGHVPCQVCISLDDAVQKAVSAATEGDTVLLSPGCASQDMYKDYAERGNHFRNALKRRLKK